MEVTIGGRRCHVVNIDTEEAARIYDRLALFHHGPDAELNFPRSHSRTRPSWGAQIYRGRVYNLESYTSEREAARAYDRAARALFGKDAKLNFPNGPWS